MSHASQYPEKRDSAWVARRLVLRSRVRRWALALAMTLAVAAGASTVFFRSPLADRGFDGRRYTVAEVIDGDTFVLADSRATRVTLLGVDAPDWPDAHFSHEAAAYLAGRLRGQPVLLKLDGTQTRDPSSRLWAYVYLGEANLVNADIIRDGRAYSDRRLKHTYRQQFDQIENEARTKARGLWDEISDEKMPPWRLEWLRERKR